MSEVTYCYSRDGETFSDDLDEIVEEVICGMESYKVGDEIELERGEKKVITAADLIHHWDVLEHMQEQLADEVGEVSDQWDLTKEQREAFDKDLKAFVDGWMTEHKLQPTCWAVKRAKLFKVRLTKVGEYGYEFEEVIDE
jgi:hypothetical protein